MNYHSDVFVSNWANLTFSQQMGNIGSEVSRMVKWRDKDNVIAERAFERMLELTDLTLQGKMTGTQLKEITRARELLVSSWFEDNELTRSDLNYLNKYFFQFALMAKK